MAAAELGARAANIPAHRAIANLPSGTDMFDIYRTRPKFLVKHDFVRHRSNTHFSPHEGTRMPSSLGDKIRKHRLEKGYSLDKLAKRTDSSKSYLWELENRDTRKPSGEKLTRVAEALSVTTDYLLDESAEPNENVLREAFFRKFNKLDPNDQKKIEQMIDAWRKKS